MIELTSQIIALTLVSGVIVGLFLGTFGGGGSVLAAPLLIYLVGIEDPHVAIGTSAAGVAAIALVGLVGHWRGGGFLIVPGLMLAVGMTMANATASSLVSVAIFGAATSANYALSGMVDARIVLLLLCGGVLGGVVGILIAKGLADRVRIARIAFATMILAVAAFVAISASQSVFFS